MLSNEKGIFFENIDSEIRKEGWLWAEIKGFLPSSLPACYSPQIYVWLQLSFSEALVHSRGWLRKNHHLAKNENLSVNSNQERIPRKSPSNNQKVKNKATLKPKHYIQSRKGEISDRVNMLGSISVPWYGMFSLIFT